MTELPPEQHRPLPGAEWHNITDPKARRKLQNRLNQRARRSRKTDRNRGPVIKHWTPSATGGHFVYASTPSKDSRQRYTLAKQLTSDRDTSSVTSSDDSDITDFSRENLEAIPVRLVRGTPQSEVAWLGPQRARAYQLARRRGYGFANESSGLHNDRLLTLIYYNVLRALTWNMEILGLDMLRMQRDDYVSPFYLSSSPSSSMPTLPRCLQPTETQLRIKHYPGYDVFPCSAVRDNMINKRMNREEEMEFFLDTLGLGSPSRIVKKLDSGAADVVEEHRSGLTIWGDPWDIRSWEMSEYISKKYPWIVAGAIELQVYTNARRRARGWKELQFA